MVYLIVDKDSLLHVTLVKAESREVLEKRIQLSETEVIAGSLTDNEIDVLHTSHFVVLTS